MSLSWVKTLERVINGALDAWNRYKRKSNAKSPANTIANNDDDGVLKSETTYKDLADKSKRD